jgi:hypothetical protein
MLRLYVSGMKLWKLVKGPVNAGLRTVNRSRNGKILQVDFQSQLMPNPLKTDLGYLQEKPF